MRGILPDPGLVRIYGRWTGVDQQIKRGEYLLEPYLTAESLLKLLVEGDVIEYQVTLPEGITLEATLEILAGEEQLDITIEGITDPRILELIEPREQPEGLVFSRQLPVRTRRYRLEYTAQSARSDGFGLTGRMATA